MAHLLRRPALIVLSCLAVSCGDPARVGGRTLAEHLEHLDAAPEQMHGALVEQLGGFGAAGNAAVPRLEGLLRTDPLLRDQAARALAGIGTPAAQSALLGALEDRAVDPQALDAVAEAAPRCVPPDRLAAAVRALCREDPGRAARLLVTDRAFDAILADPSLRREVVTALAAGLDALDPRGRAATLRRLAALGADAAGSEDILARAIARGIAVDDAVEALAMLGTEEAFAVVEEALANAPAGRSAVLLAAVPRFPDAPAGRVLAALDRLSEATDPALRQARIAALAALVRARPDQLEAVGERLDAELEAAHPAVSDAALSEWLQLAADGIVDPRDTAAELAAHAIAADDPSRARRLAAALGRSALPDDVAVPALARIGAEAPAVVAAAAEKALANRADPRARAARAAVLARPEVPDAARRAAILLRDPALEGAELGGVLTILARGRRPFVAGLLDALDTRSVQEQRTALRHLVRTEDLDPAVRAAAERRLRELDG